MSADGSLERRLKLLRNRANAIFDLSDSESRGWLSKNNLKKAIQADDALRIELRTTKWATLWEELDTDNDGKIEREELVAYMTKLHLNKAEEHKNNLKKFASDMYADGKRQSMTRAELKEQLESDLDILEEVETSFGDSGADFFQALVQGDDNEITLEEVSAYIDQTTDDKARAIVDDVIEDEGKEASEPKKEEEGTADDAEGSNNDADNGGVDDPHADETTAERLSRLHLNAKELFKLADKNGDGVLSKNELKNMLKKRPDLRKALRVGEGVNWRQFWEDIDTDGDGQISEPEFLAFFSKVTVQHTDTKIQSVSGRAEEIFKLADKNGDGILTKNELKRLLHQDDDIRLELRAAHGRHWNSFWDELDEDGDGKISLEELRHFIARNHSRNLGEELSALSSVH